ncbi:arsenate reductase [Psychromonas ingrahamii 37]|uniref:Arsenate reductase n=1 Tax=Psychromonas ingrahamii (strain DSM 17664 / CCUG 51855 / 37) TaxID=357804 RepID=A1SXF8_PSYIN|nr:ArsC family reductase [Psychromonas ingrahamii]ABM04173.1 arsenate reductase [Psychromonas ingrahamii 37]
MNTTLYGIPNCDSVKKARKWLEQNNLPYTFHDYRKDGLDKTLLDSFLENIEWTDLINKRSTSFRQLTAEQKENLSAETVIALFIAFPTLIKRPLLRHNNHYQLGFNIDTYQTLFSL